MNFRKHYEYPRKTMLELLSHQNPEPHHMQIKENVKIMFFEVPASQALIRYFTEERVNNSQKYVMLPLILALKCCESESKKLN
jgi:hypothetical protein